MKFPSVVFVASAVMACSAAQAAGAVEVSYVNPEQFTDVRDANYFTEQNLKTLQEAVKMAAAPYVADGQTLKIEVLDVDLAGEVRPGARVNIRVLRGRADWPRITLRWTLEGAGSPSRHGEALVQDMAYLNRLPTAMAGDALAYERRMLDEYFKAQFGKAGEG